MRAFFTARRWYPWRSALAVFVAAALFAVVVGDGGLRSAFLVAAAGAVGALAVLLLWKD